jgi:hypothetical protein
MRRIILNNISIYENEEVIYYPKESTWDDCKSRLHFFNKWAEKNDNKIVRLLDEEKYDYNIGESNNSMFLPALHSIVSNPSQLWLERNLDFLDIHKNIFNI